ncbi:titin homolog isoform X2 [Polistes fuscatus]|uniref:titin homolog isoform X2 n=1 Tax=Polistes fuscatus TaxID=30207 RepID=UPI001CA82CBE|nr:titin homolog isoform X2 [Polistes fuscatus]
MAADNEASCASDPNFAVICSFLECFGKSCGIVYPDMARLQEMIENTQEVPQQLVDLHIKLLRKTRKTVSPEKWERALVKFCHTYSNQDGWELERFGYKKARTAVKLRLLKVLLETQFDLNQKFKNEVNKLAADELRVEPLGKDKTGLAYWCQFDEECNIRVYREDLDEENWELVAKDREGVANLINSLSNGEAESIPINEDSNSLEISEKPIIDTGQVTTSPSLEENEVILENGTHNGNLEDKDEQKDALENVDDHGKNGIIADQDNADIENDEEEIDEEDEEEEDDDEEEEEEEEEEEDEEEEEEEDEEDEEDGVTNDESSKQNTEEDDSLEVAQGQVTESNIQLASTLKVTNGSAHIPVEKIIAKKTLPEEAIVSHTSDTKPLEIVKSENLTKSNINKITNEELVPLKSIETPVITSPLKLVNIADLKQIQEEKNPNHILPISTPINISKKHNTMEETTESVMKSLEKLSGKNSLSFAPTDITSGHSKLSVKPIDQLAANLVRIQAEKLEKPSGAKSLEKIAENLARSGGILNSTINGDDDRLPQDFCPRSQPEKPAILRGHRGMDLSTSPRGWESVNEQSIPVDFSGSNLSSRKFTKSMDLSTPGYRSQNFQHREMDLSTKKSSKSDVQNLSYDSRAVMMRNHAMVADLSKRQMPFTAYEMSAAAYHTSPRLPPKEEHRLPSYALLPDPSKITALRMGPTSLKRPLEGDDAQSDILKRIRPDVIPIRGSLDKRTIINNSWREDIGEAIEEPLMMVQGEGSGSDCDAVNPEIGEPIEEPVMVFYGEGSGVECDTGNPGDDTSTDNKESSQSKSEADSATASLSSSEILNEENLIKEVSTASMETSKNPVRFNRNYSQSNVDVNESQIVGSTQEKPKFKPTLGVQIIPKSTSGSIKRLSRWDVGKPAEKTECDSSIISNEEDISQKEQYFPKEGTSNQNCSNTDESTLQTSEDLSLSKAGFECLSSTDNLNEKMNANSSNEVSTLDQNSIESNITDTDAIDSNSKKSKENSKLLETIQCDSSISSCQADTSEILESSTNAILVPYSLSSEKVSTNVSDSCNIVTQNSEFLHKIDNECKPKSASPPRFFFGPNCISYTSKSTDLETQSDQIVTTSIQCKSDTLQYECVSSSKPSEDTLLSYKSEEFDVTQTNNNSLKASSFDSHNIYCTNDKREKLEGSSHAWNSNEGSVSNAIDVSRTTQIDDLQSNTVQESEETTVKFNKSESTDVVSQSFITNNVNVTLNTAESLKNSSDLQHKKNIVIDNDMKTEHVTQYNENITTDDQSRFMDNRSYQSTNAEKDANLNISDNIQETVESPSTYSENEAEYKSLKKEETSHEIIEKTESDLTTNTCMSPCNKDQDQDVQMESKNVQECAVEDNANMLESTDLISSPNFQEVHSSAGVQEIDNVSDEFQALKKDEVDLNRESYDKHSDKNDNLSEFDIQEEQSMDTDTEKMKGQISSDADSMSVNYDKNSERNDTLSDLGVQDEGSGDSEEIKEKQLINSFIKTNASEDIPESDLVDNATVSSSACMQEYNKESFASVISSSNDGSVKNIFLQDNSNIPVVSQQIDNPFSAKTSNSAFNVLAPIASNISIIKSAEISNMPSLKENYSSSIDQSVNEYADDVSENPSSCIDQDSNEDMIIDDRMSESNESSKEVEETPPNGEKLVIPSDSDKSTVSNDNLLSDQNIRKEDNFCMPNNLPLITENQKNALDISTTSNKESNSPITAEIFVEQKDSNNKIKSKESDNVQITETYTEKSETAISNSSYEDTDIKLKEDMNNAEKQNVVQNEISLISNESEKSSVNKQSLVANYDSNDSNDDGSDDVFEADMIEDYESTDIPNCSVEEHTVNDNKITKNTNIERECTDDKKYILLDESQQFVHDKGELESNLQIATDKVFAKNEIENKKETCNVNSDEVINISNNKNIEVSYECDDNKCSDISKNEQTINESNTDEYRKDTVLHNTSPLDSSSKVNNTTTILTASSDHSNLQTFVNEKTEAEFQITSNQIVKEYMNNTANNKSVLGETTIIKLQNESKPSIIQSVQDIDNSVFEKLDSNKNTDNTENTANLIQVQKNSGSGDINDQPTNILDNTVSVIGQQITEKVNDKDNVTKSKEMQVTEVLLKSQQYQGLKTNYLENESEQKKFETKECNYIDNSVNEFTVAETCNQSVPNTSTIKLDNDIQQASQSFETHSLVQLKDSNISDNINHTNFIANKPTVSYDISDDKSKQTDFINISNTNKDNIYTKSVLNIQNTITACTVQEPIFEKKEELLGILRNDVKKEGNKRTSDISEVEDVPPLKSKPPYIKPFVETLSTDIKYNSQSETKMETVIEKKELKLESNILNKVNESLIIPPIIDAYNAAVSNIEAEDKFKKDSLPKDNLDVKNKKDLSEIKNVEVKPVTVSSDDSMGGDHEDVFDAPSEEPDPLACTEDDTLKGLNINIGEDNSNAKIAIRVRSVSELVYEGWKMDDTEIPKVSRKRRNSAQDSNVEDLGEKQEEEEEMMGGKRIKLRAKRIPDKQLRKSVEESRIVTISSEDEAVKCKIAEDNKDCNDDDVRITRSIPMGRKNRGRPRGRRRRCRGGGRSRPKHSGGVNVNQTTEESPNIHLEGTPTNASSLETTPSSSQKKRKKRKMVLGLEIGRDIAPEQQEGALQGETPVRQSRRIAQLKIKEAADRRRIEEETLTDVKEKKDTTDKKKRRKQKNESEEEVTMKEIDKDIKSNRKRKKRKKKKMLAKFNEANPWQSSSGSSTDNDVENEDEEEEEEIETEGSLLFKSDHEFSPESDLEKDQESEPLRRARTAQKAQSDVEEADDEYACQKCGKADHPEWILLCDSCDKGWHCSCLRPALMLIPEGDWFCPPCQHNILVSKLRESLKTYDQLSKRHENEVLRKKRLAYVGISLDNVLQKNETQRLQKDLKESSQESENESSSEQSSSASSSETSSSEESEPVYQLRVRRCANTYKFNEYDDMINAAIQDEVEAVQGAGNQGRGKDIATIVNAEKEEAQLHQQVEALQTKDVNDDKNDLEQKSERESDEEYKVEKEEADEEEEERKRVNKRLLARRKHRKLNSLDISSEDDPESDEDFKGTSSDDEEDFDDHMTSSDESSFTDSRRRGRRGDSRPVRRSTRARITTTYDPDFINDDSDESDRPKRKKSRSVWENSDSEDSDNSWRQRKKKSRTIPTSRYRTTSKIKSKKKKKRKRIIESDNQSDNEEEEEPRSNDNYTSENINTVLQEGEEAVSTKVENVENIADLQNIENTENTHNTDAVKTELIENTVANTDTLVLPQIDEITAQKKKKESAPKQKKAPTIRRKIIYGGLPDDNYKQEEEEILDRRSRRRGRKINYQEATATDSEEELKKAIRKTVESEDEFVVNEIDDVNEDAEKDSDSDIYTPKKDVTKLKNKSPKSKKPRKSKSPAANRKTLVDGVPKPRKKPGPKPGSKNKARREKLLMGSVIRSTDGQHIDDKDVLSHTMDNPMGELTSKIDDGLPDNVGLTGTTISVASSFTGDVPEGSLGGLGPGELADLDDEQLEQIMMEDEEYGRRQLELAAIEIAKKKKKEEREAKKLEKARLKALEILAAERQRDPNAPEGTDGEVPKKKKRGRRSKAEIIAEQMRRGGAPTLGSPGLANTSPGVMAANSSNLIGLDVSSNVSPNINPNLPTVITPEADRTPEGHIPMMTGPDGQLFNPDGTPMKPKRRGRGKGKKTLALEAARAAEAAAKAAAEAGLLGMGTDSNPEVKSSDIPNVLPTPGSSTSGSAPSTPPASGVPTQLPPSTQPNAQSVYSSLPPGQQSSVITRMLQSQPVSSNNPQSFTAAAAAMGHKYFGAPNATGQMMTGPRTGYEMQPRGRIPSPYRQPGQTSMPPHFAAVRSGTPPMRMRVPGPQMYHTPHHPMDPSPSGGGPISISSRDRSSPLAPGPPPMIPPAAGSPLAKGGPTPPPPSYVRGGPPISRFTDNPMGPRHQMPPFTNASPANHALQQPSPPPNRPPGNFSPYHPPPPPNYHYGAYPPPPPMSTADDAAAYQGSPYPTEHFSSPADNQPQIQAPPQPQPPQSQPPQPQQQSQTHPNDPATVANKQYDDEGTGEFGGLVSYFSSQREDDLDS